MKVTAKENYDVANFNPKSLHCTHLTVHNGLFSFDKVKSSSNNNTITSLFLTVFKFNVILLQCSDVPNVITVITA